MNSEQQSVREFRETVFSPCRLIAIRNCGTSKHGHALKLFRCECGKEKILPASSVLSGGVKSCGCLKAESSKRTGQANVRDFTGQKIGRLTVLHRQSGQSVRPAWVCLCACGNKTVVRSSNLSNGNIRSCGCLTRRTGKDHPSWKGGMSYRDGYKLITVYVGGKKRIVGEHRYKMEQKIGRALLPFENVHHKNGVRDDNRLQNLELWVKTQPCGSRASDLVAHCVRMLKLYAPNKLK